MRKLIVVLACVVMLMAALPAAAQTQITLGNPANSFIFSGDGAGNLVINLSSGTSMAGAATATGDFVGLSNHGTYVLDFVGTAPINATYVSGVAGSQTFTIVQGGPIAFSYVSSGGDTLYGDLQLVGMQQAGMLGVFNQNVTANLTNLSGTLANALSNGEATIDITIAFSTVMDLSTFEGRTNAIFSSGELRPTPEPASLMLLGGGLLSIGGALRRKLKA
ncbi:MAG TPA: PEP-CTERM sorting domain-containing protein [Clostridia bacterium]|nr:PEP-CTERM sorting domain-containing protein [Clostridia bacterium]